MPGDIPKLEMPTIKNRILKIDFNPGNTKNRMLNQEMDILNGGINIPERGIPRSSLFINF